MRIKVLLATCALLLSSTFVAGAQSAKKNFTYSAPKVTVRDNGARLDGNSKELAHISSQGLDVTALAIAFDYSQKQIKQVRAIGRVKLDLILPGKNGKPDTHIKASSNKATLNPLQRQLILEGNVDGYYQTGNGPHTALAGTKATLTQVNGLVTGQLQGPVNLVIPPQPKSTSGGIALGKVTITSESANIDEAKGQVVFLGNAHAVSADSPQKFDVKAPQFTVSRNADGSIQSLSASGHTKVKIDLPPNPPKPGKKPAKIAAPTHVEVTADSAVIDVPQNKLTFEGNVDGFYVLPQPDGAGQKYHFDGDKAVLSQQPGTAPNGGFSAEISGQNNKPVTIVAPGLSFDMGKSAPQEPAEAGK